MNNPTTLSVDDVLRNNSQTINVTSVASEGSSSSVNGSMNTEGMASTEDLIIAHYSEPTSTQQTDSLIEMPPPLADPYLEAEYRRILKQPGPKSMKRKRLDALIFNSQRQPIREILEEDQLLENVVQALAPRQNVRSNRSKRSRSRSSSSSSSSNSRSLIGHLSEDIAMPASSEDVIPAVITSSSDLLVSPPAAQQPRPQPLLPLRVATSSFSSDEARRSASSDRSIFVQPISPAASPPLPQILNPQPLDGNAHSNGAAPRRIFLARPQPSGANTGRQQRANSKNLGG